MRRLRLALGIMAAVIALHHSRQFNGIVADRYGNDPFVWVRPFLWSHCHARSRPNDFGKATTPPFVRGHDAVFFCTHHPRTGKLVCDCVFVIAQVVKIADAEARFPRFHPVRHFHFDQHQNRNPYHIKSTLTRIGHKELSFLLDPPMPIGTWIEQYVRSGKLTVTKYFQGKRIKNVRVITKNANELYNRALRWSKGRGHRKIGRLSMHSLRMTMCPSYPAEGPIIWRRDEA